MLLKDDGVSNAKSEDDDDDIQLGFKSLFQKANVRTISIVLFINWTLVNLGYYGVSLSSGNLSDDIFVSYILISLIGEQIREKWYILEHFWSQGIFQKSRHTSFACSPWTTWDGNPSLLPPCCWGEFSH